MEFTQWLSPAIVIAIVVLLWRQTNSRLDRLGEQMNGRINQLCDGLDQVSRRIDRLCGRLDHLADLSPTSLPRSEPLPSLRANSCFCYRLHRTASVNPLAATDRICDHRRLSITHMHPRIQTTTKLLLVLLAATAALALPHSAFAQCESLDAETTAFGLTPTLISTVSQDFTVCYDPEFADDLALFREWVAKGMELGLQKYGFAGPLTRDGEAADTLIFLPPAPTAKTSRGYIGFTTGSRSDLGNGLWRAELHYLTPSAWGSPPYGGLSYPTAEEYHAHYIVHETMHVVQFGLEDTSGYDAQRWIWEALAEYDGYFHTTEWNRTEAIYRLFDRSEEKNLPATIYCCRTLRGESPAMVTTDVYYGGAIVMMFLAEHFGEKIHAGLFASPMADLMMAGGTTVDETFTRFQTWYMEKLDEVSTFRATSTRRAWPAPGSTGTATAEESALRCAFSTTISDRRVTRYSGSSTGPTLRTRGRPRVALGSRGPPRASRRLSSRASQARRSSGGHGPVRWQRSPTRRAPTGRTSSTGRPQAVHRREWAAAPRSPMTR